MDLYKSFTTGSWNNKIDVTDFVRKNITPYEGDASFLVGPTERTLSVWSVCLKALEERRALFRPQHRVDDFVSRCWLY